jgi:hypothetical protein
MIIKEGSRWWAGDEKRFVVTSVVEVDEQVWVHYKDDKNEYSCYQESFVDRFSPLPD